MSDKPDWEGFGRAIMEFWEQDADLDWPEVEAIAIEKRVLVVSGLHDIHLNYEPRPC